MYFLPSAHEDVSTVKKKKKLSAVWLECASSQRWLHITIIWGDFKNLAAQALPRTSNIRFSWPGAQTSDLVKAPLVIPMCIQG